MNTTSTSCEAATQQDSLAPTLQSEQQTRLRNKPILS